MGSHGVIPSNTSRYTSADIGLIHMVGLDLNDLDTVQLAWLEADLARVNQNRSKTPWIMVMSHFPLFHTQTAAHANMSAAHYTGDERMGEYAVDGREMKFEPCPQKTRSDGGGGGGNGSVCQTVGEFQAQLGNALQPLFRKHGVDLHVAPFCSGPICGWPHFHSAHNSPCPRLWLAHSARSRYRSLHMGGARCHASPSAWDVEINLKRRP
jgi:hypothetical protein